MNLMIYRKNINGLGQHSDGFSVPEEAYSSTVHRSTRSLVDPVILGACRGGWRAERWLMIASCRSHSLREVMMFSHPLLFGNGLSWQQK